MDDFFEKYVFAGLSLTDREKKLCEKLHGQTLALLEQPYRSQIIDHFTSDPLPDVLLELGIGKEQIARMRKMEERAREELERRQEKFHAARAGLPPTRALAKPKLRLMTKAARRKMTQIESSAKWSAAEASGRRF
jgi:hypothetical protein